MISDTQGSSTPTLRKPLFITLFPRFYSSQEKFETDRRREREMGSTKPSKREEESNPLPLPTSLAASSAAAAVAAGLSSAMASLAVDGAEVDECLAGSDVLSREEVIRRRSRRVRQLFQCYQRQYWALMEEVRVKHRDYYWEFGLSPFDEEEGDEEHRPTAASDDEAGERRPTASGEAVMRLGLDEGKKEERKRCAYNSCKTKAMPLTRYCHAHILNDPRQVLYKPCSHVIRSSGQGAPLACGKPVLRAAVPSLCPTHSDKARKTFLQALRKAGLNVSSTSKIPKFSVFIAESVRQTQARRREASNSLANKTGQKDEKID